MEIVFRGYSATYGQTIDGLLSYSWWFVICQSKLAMENHPFAHDFHGVQFSAETRCAQLSSTVLSCPKSKLSSKLLPVGSRNFHTLSSRLIWRTVTRGVPTQWICHPATPGDAKECRKNAKPSYRYKYSGFTLLD